MALWRDCASWLERLGLVPDGDPVRSTRAELRDLVALLRDGVVLCRLVALIRPNSIDLGRVQLEPPEPSTGRAVSDFLCRKNVFLFLHAVALSFEIDQEKLFEPEDLYQCRDVGRVLETLSTLSHTEESRAHVPGFPKKESQLAKRLHKEQGDYEVLNHLYGEAETEYLYDSFSTSLREEVSAEDSHYEDIYQTIFPPRQSRLPLDISFRRKNKREAPMQELLETEDKYLENLIMVRDVFRQPLVSSATLVQHHMDTIFLRLDDLIDLHSDILFGLQQKKADIGLVFLDHLLRLGDLYGDYCLNLPVAMNLLEKLISENVAFKRQLLQCQTHARPTTFPLSSHLVIPFQRFLKYHLLLKEILKHTPKHYADKENIELASAEILRVGQEVNERKREFEEDERQLAADEADRRLVEGVKETIKLMQLPGNSSLADLGRLRKAGDITVYTELGKAADYAFLFDMAIVLCHKPKWLQHRYRFREAAKIKDYYLEPIQEQPSSSSSSYLQVFSVRLFCRLDSRKPPITFIAKTATERDAWFAAVLMAMDNVSPAENAEMGHVLQMTTFHGGPHQCFQCWKNFKGNFFQGYRCLRCQVNLHKQCIAQCHCIEVSGSSTLKKANSISLPTALPDTLERSNSALSLISQSKRGKLSRQVQELQAGIEQELEMIPFEEQPWFAGQLSGKVASDRLEALPVGTFLVRQRANGQFALMLKTLERPRGVKAMAINRENHKDGKYFFSGARKFESIQQLVTFYRNNDLTENFDYLALKGVTLKIPYKNL